MSEVFRKHGWTVIANKYYIDDHQDTVREIDLIAYRSTKLPDFRVTTVVVVSCKKNEKDQIDALNNHSGLRLHLSEQLKVWYRYEGKSRFGMSEIPF